MGNKNRNLIVAYFPNADAADRAGQQLKHWDKSEAEIKLGGMGVIVEKDGRLDTELIGSRAAGTGAKWGTILGATGGLATGVLALTGVLTGGIGLIPAAIAGLVIGTAGGTLLHKKVGMSDADRDRLLAHLRNGGAALAVMADDHEVEPTKAELATQGGQVEAYNIPDAVMEEIEDVSGAADEAQAGVAERFAGQSIEVQDQAAIMAAAVPALGVAGVAALHEAGVTDINTLQAKTATEAGRAELAAAAGVDAATVQKWAKDLEFAHIRGVGPKYAALLKAAGIETVDDLAEANAVALARKLDEMNKVQNIVKEVPEADRVAYWIAQANEGPDVIALKTVTTVTKDMLNVDAYSWKAKEGDDPRKIQMDAVMFNRKEGYEVIPMIQKVVNTFGYESVDDVKRIEEIIATELPGNVRSRKNVFNWLVDYIEAH